MKSRRRHLLLTVVGFAAVLGFSSVLSAGEPLGRCATAWVPHPIVLPDGSSHDPGSMRLCLERTSPVQATYEISINGRQLGQWPSRRGQSEGPPEPYALIVFRWTGDARLQLIGFARPNGQRTSVYAFHGYGKVPESVKIAASTMLDPAHRDDYVMIKIA